LNAREIDGVRFVPVNFTPNASIYAGQKCGGVSIIVTDREDARRARARPGDCLGTASSIYPDDFKTRRASTCSMRNKATLDALDGRGRSAPHCRGLAGCA
jgi:uncharacterized protein YbbC (DUF1343 family)